MTFKFICAFLLLSVIFLSSQAKHHKNEKKKGDKHNDDDVEVVPVHFDTLTYLNKKITCTDHNRKTDQLWCTCPFTLCTGAQQCYQYWLGEDVRCTLEHDNIDYESNLTRDDCRCRYDKK